MIVQFVNQQSKHPTAVWRELLKRVMPEALAATTFGRSLQRQGIDAAVTVTFVGPRQMRQLNQDTRQVDSTTDVLSYPLLNLTAGSLDQPLKPQDFDPEPAEKPIVPLGDIIICLEKAFAQAEEYGHPVEREIAFLAVHGLLHLLGYDHLTSAEEKRMIHLQKKILDQTGLGRGDKK